MTASDPDVPQFALHDRYVWLVCGGATLGGFLFGYDMIVISGAERQVVQQFDLTSVAEGQFTNMAVIGCLAGVAIALVEADRVSRKSLLTLSAVCLLVGAIGTAAANSVLILFFMRWLGGVGVGVASVLSPLYVSEMAPAEIRGRLGALFQIMINVGLLAAALVNAQLAICSLHWKFAHEIAHLLFVEQVWRAMFLMQAVPAALFLTVCLLLPETPRWLIKQGRDSEAGAVLARVRSAAVARLEYDEIQRSFSGVEPRMWQLLRPPFRGRIGVGLFLTLIGDLSGITAVFYYGPGILERAGMTASGSMLGFAVISLFIVGGTALSAWLIDRVGRRPLLAVSTIGCIVSLCTAGSIFRASQPPMLLGVITLCAFVLFFGIGLGPVKFVVLSEIFPTALRGRASAICTLGLWISVSTVASAFPVMRDEYSISACFFIFAAILSFGLPIILWKVPETKGVSLEAV